MTETGLLQTTVGSPTLSAVVFFLAIVALTLAVTYWAARRTRPWLVVMGLGSRDFRNPDDAVTPVLRTFFDASADLPFAQEVGLSRSEAQVRRFWKLYRYRSFGRAIVQTELDRLKKNPAVGVVDYAYGSTSFVMPNVLAKLGVHSKLEAVVFAVRNGAVSV